jgi:chloramphenicol 3-O-phosphotransferase
METDDWAKHRIAELEAAAPVKRKKVKPFVKVQLDTVARAFAAVHCSKAIVYLWLVYQAWKTGKRTVPVPNGALTKYGVPRETKRRALRELEDGGLITVEQRSRKTPLATLL